jgi:hypothetical protein
MPTLKIRMIANNLIMHFKFLEKEEQVKLQISRWKETIMIRVEINGKEAQ